MCLTEQEVAGTLPLLLLTRRSPEVFSGEQVNSLLEELGVTHVITVPDSTIGRWESAIEGSARVRLVRVCREGEAWQVAGGPAPGRRDAARDDPVHRAVRVR